MINFYSAARRFHKIFVIIILVLGAIMTFTGLLLKYQFLQTDLVLMRYIHNNLSAAFAVVLLVMMLTGAYMYLYPWHAKRQAARTTQQEE